MSTTFALSRTEMDRLEELISVAVGNVSRGLTEMFSADIAVTAIHIRAMPLGEIGNLLGNAELEVAGVYLTAEGDIPGHLMLLMTVPAAMGLCDILLELPEGTTAEFGEMEVSALGEVGNIVGSFFLNSIADTRGLRLQVTPPSILCDMAGAAISLALVDVAMYADEAVVIDAYFEHRGRHLPAWFLAFPDPERLRAALDLGAER
jgi:chemotaxis protein CheC